VDWIRDRGLTLVLVALFMASLVAQVLAGHAAYNSEQADHGASAVSLSVYLSTGHPWEALFENWESEFLQMAVFVLLTTFLIQRGSPESRRPGVKELVDSDPRDFASQPDVPWPVKRGGWVLRLYARRRSRGTASTHDRAWVRKEVGHVEPRDAEVIRSNVVLARRCETLAGSSSQRSFSAPTAPWRTKRT
jgi:hypothetical protein